MFLVEPQTTCICIPQQWLLLILLVHLKELSRCAHLPSKSVVHAQPFLICQTGVFVQAHTAETSNLRQLATSNASHLSHSMRLANATKDEAHVSNVRAASGDGMWNTSSPLHTTRFTYRVPVEMARLGQMAATKQHWEQQNTDWSGLL